MDSWMQRGMLKWPLPRRRLRETVQGSGPGSGASGAGGGGEGEGGGGEGEGGGGLTFGSEGAETFWLSCLALSAALMPQGAQWLAGARHELVNAIISPHFRPKAATLWLADAGSRKACWTAMASPGMAMAVALIVLASGEVQLQESGEELAAP